MGEIFRREAAEQPEPFTGERLTAAAGGQVEIEHYHRYLFARALVRGLDVLDVASGEGYGAALLAQVARSVMGVEHSEPTVRGAVANFPRPNLRFLSGDARALPLGDASLDAVVSFETIEHFDRQKDFVREVRRVLRPDGRFIVSTPDRDIYSHPGAAVNPFHAQELSRSEFVSLLRESFRHVALTHQRPLIGSALLGESGSPVPPLVFDRRGDMYFEACIGLPRAPYIVAVASDREIPPLPPSVYIDRSDVDTDKTRASALAARLAKSQAQLAQARADLQAAEQAHAAAVERSETLQQQFDRVQSSLRIFARGYLPRLRRHLRGQRP
jgi:SAM-dependent methyltransferase